MPHQCVHCGKIIEPGSREILDGCAKCSGRFFFYIKDEKAKQILEQQQAPPLQNLTKPEIEKVESDVREILKVEDEDEPVILDIESVRVLSPGKFEIDIVSLLNRKPIVFKLQEGKYMIDIESSLPIKKEDKKEN